MLIVFPVTLMVLCLLAAVAYAGKMHERSKWNELIEEGIIQKPVPGSSAITIDRVYNGSKVTTVWTPTEIEAIYRLAVRHGDTVCPWNSPMAVRHIRETKGLALADALDTWNLMKVDKRFFAGLA